MQKLLPLPTVNETADEEDLCVGRWAHWSGDGVWFIGCRLGGLFDRLNSACHVEILDEFYTEIIEDDFVAHGTHLMLGNEIQEVVCGSHGVLIT